MQGTNVRVQLGIVHLDMKDDNVLIDLSRGPPRAVVCDWGVAQSLAPDTMKLRHDTVPVITDHESL